MSTFNCPKCSGTFIGEASWFFHMRQRHGLLPVPRDSKEAVTSQTTLLDSNISTPSILSADNSNPTPGQFKVKPKATFKVVYDLGRGDEAQPIRVTIPKDESYDKFLSRLHNVFYGDSFERSLRQWEYVLVNHRYEKSDPLALTSSKTYYAMASELLRPRTEWRHAMVRRSVSLMR